MVSLACPDKVLNIFVSFFTEMQFPAGLFLVGVSWYHNLKQAWASTFKALTSSLSLFY